MEIDKVRKAMREQLKGLEGCGNLKLVSKSEHKIMHSKLGSITDKKASSFEVKE